MKTGTTTGTAKFDSAWNPRRLPWQARVDGWCISYLPSKKEARREVHRLVRQAKRYNDCSTPLWSVNRVLFPS